MKEGFHRSKFTPPEERNLHQFKGKNSKEIIEDLEGIDADQEYPPDDVYAEHSEDTSIFDGFLELLRKKGVRVSTSEWLQFLAVIGKKTTAKNLEELVSTDELLTRIRLFGKATLVKDKADEAAFHEAFEEYFELATKVYRHELNNKQRVVEQQEPENHQKDEDLQDHQPEIKEKLGIQEVDENLDLPEGEHADNEQVHGGKQDQHNDILRRADMSKKGGGDKKEDQEKVIPPESSESQQQEVSDHGLLVGGGKGKSVYAERSASQQIVHGGSQMNKQEILERKKRAGGADRRLRYEVRPDKASMREVIRNIRRIITDVSDVKSRSIDSKRTVKSFARRNFRFEYEKEREKQSEIVLFIDVGGPVDEWSPLINEVAQEMTKGLTRLEVYLFHNNLYGYVWEPDPKNLLASSYARPNSLLDIKKIVKHRKKVIIYGDAEMSYSEFESDGWPPRGNEDRVDSFGMEGEECLKFIKKKAGAVVWINPIFQREWGERDDSGTLNAARQIISMHDLTVGGVEDAISELMSK